jgi:hypothetical protein
MPFLNSLFDAWNQENTVIGGVRGKLRVEGKGVVIGYRKSFESFVRGVSDQFVRTMFNVIFPIFRRVNVKVRLQCEHTIWILLSVDNPLLCFRTF